VKIFLNAIAFVCVLILSNDIFAQSIAKPATDKNPVIVEIANQFDSPVHISLTGVDLSNDRFQTINLTIQNVSEKSIRGYVLNTGSIETRYYPRKQFLRDALYTDQVRLSSSDIRPDTKLQIYVDYVAFTDGTGWGEDKDKRSESISGMTSGGRAAADEVSALVNGSGVEGLKNILSTPPDETVVSMPAGVQNRSDEWLRGFRTGYRGFIQFVQARYNDPDFLTLLEEARKNLN